jgi:DNA-binding CsgD family transcriptional regulator
MDRKTPRKFATTPGTRDVLPPESTRLLDVQGRIRNRFELFGFREVLTPALEYSEVIEEHGLRDVSYKLFDQDNQMLLLRPEMTTPIARLISQRLAGSPPPHKLSYILPAYRRASVGRGQSAELYQAGVEVEVLRLLARGHINREIARELNFSVTTVKNHVKHIITKLDVSDRTQAAARAVEIGLMDPER